MQARGTTASLQGKGKGRTTPPTCLCLVDTTVGCAGLRGTSAVCNARLHVARVLYGDAGRRVGTGFAWHSHVEFWQVWLRPKDLLCQTEDARWSETLSTVVRAMVGASLVGHASVLQPARLEVVAPKDIHGASVSAHQEPDGNSTSGRAWVFGKRDHMHS